MSEAGGFKDAERWLAQRGVPRDPIRVPLTAPEPAQEGGGAQGPAAPDASSPAPPTSAREAGRLAAEAHDEAVRRADERAATPDPAAPRLDDDVAEAVAFLRRSTAMAPQSEARLRDKLRGRGTPSAVVEQALERARRERLVDDEAMVAALVDERRRKGHAPARIRRDLRERGFDAALLDRALTPADAEDPEAAAYALASEKAARCTGLAPEAAFRRVAAHVVRRGYAEGLARKVAREAVFTARDAQRTAGH
ncbi:regulatory protein RecX [Egicoccus sp. AB-alg2]|uniref:regulatory protein RecX n=1 Tax=Egicoccus sp. AB-alg2 TaxID=3242693 RepID=UPI00359D50D5